MLKFRCGFTLVEILVAMVIFAIVGVMVSVALRRGLAVQAHWRAEVARWKRLEYALVVLQDDLRHQVNRPVRDGGNHLLPAFLSKSDAAIALTRTGFFNAKAPGAITALSRVAYHFEQGALWRWRWPVLDRVPTTRPIKTRLLDHVRALRFILVDRRGRAVSVWPPLAGSSIANAQCQALSLKALRLQMDVARIGRVTMTYPMSVEACDASR